MKGISIKAEMTLSGIAIFLLECLLIILKILLSVEIISFAIWVIGLYLNPENRARKKIEVNPEVVHEFFVISNPGWDRI